MIRKLVNFVFPLCLNNTKMIESKLIQITVKMALTKLSVIKGRPSSKRWTFTKSTHPRHVINKCQDVPFIIAINFMGKGKYPSMLWFNFIIGSNFISHCFKLIIIHYHTPKQREIKFEPRMKLNHNIYT